MKHLNIRVRGLVQGVWFRDTARREANKLGIKGFARNDQDGSVYIEAEGTEESLDKLVAWCHIGSIDADVAGVESREGEMQYFDRFTTG